MDEYISREAVVHYLKGYSEKECNSNSPYGMITSSVLNKAERALSEMPAADVQLMIETENMATVSNEFICKKCGLHLKDYIKVVMDEDNDGYIDEQHYDYEPKFCPECGAKVESCIKTPKRDKPLYTMNEICKMNGVEFNPR